MRVLLAEDEPDIQLITRLALEDAGHEVVAVEDGLQALERLARETFDVVLLDVMMPRMDGFTVCAQIQTNPQIRHLPVIFLTANVQESDADQVMNKGARGYIIKPFDVYHLADRIVALMGSAPVP